MDLTLTVSLIGICTSISSIVFALLAFKRNERIDNKEDGKNEGLIISEIGYIKACVDRVEKNIFKIDELYRSLIERMAKVEESLANVTKRVDEIYKLE